MNSCPTATVEHEATTSKISEDQMFYCGQRGIGPEDAVGLIVNGVWSLISWKKSE